MEDRDIVELYWQRSDRAVQESEKKYGPWCRTIAQNIVADLRDAEECVSDTWLAAWNAMPDKRPGKAGRLPGNTDAKSGAGPLAGRTAPEAGRR